MAAQADVKSMGAEACGIVDPLLASKEAWEGLAAPPQEPASAVGLHP